jgi:hypothetical protein
MDGSQHVGCASPSKNGDEIGDGGDEMVGFLQVKFKPGAEPKPPRLANPRMAAADF